LTAARPRGGWLARARQRRAARALERQLAYQTAKARALAGHTDAVGIERRRFARAVREFLARVRPIPPDARVLEIGSGAHGLIFFFDAPRGVGLDPLAVEYAALFPDWQRRVPTVAAAGERVPFPDRSFDMVLCDNVIDHADDPGAIVAEIDRLLVPGGLVYFTVNVHHPIYAVASAIHGAWSAMGVRFEIGPFADHTVHLTPRAARALFGQTTLEVLSARVDFDAGRHAAASARHVGDRLKRLFYKNARLAIGARRPLFVS
jgi:SAM-dependent methyltransferase